MTVERVRQQFVDEGLDAALHRRRPTGRQYRKLDGAQEARLIALACSDAARRARPAGPCSCWPTGWSSWRWSTSIDPTRPSGGRLKKRAQAVAEAAVGHPAGGERRVRGGDGGRAGGVPPAATTRARPVVCLDEGGKQLIGEVARAAAGRPGSARPSRTTSTSGTGRRTCSWPFEPLAGWRHVEVTERRTAVDFAAVPAAAGATSVYPDGREGGAGDGQPEHAHAGVAVRGVRAGRGAAAGGAAGVALHAQARVVG